MKRILSALLLSAALALVGCRSAYIEATVQNRTGAAVRLVEVDYPSASFGKEVLPDGAEFKYRFKVLGAGPTKITWTGPDRKEHTVAGPALKEGDGGRMIIQLEPQTAVWTPKLGGQ